MAFPRPVALSPTCAPVDGAQSGGTAWPNVPVPIAHQITEFFQVRSVLFIRGFCEKVEGAAPFVLLRLWDGQWVGIEVRDDPFNPTTEERFSFSAHYTLPANVTSDQLNQVAVILRHRRGYCLIERPAGNGQSGDAYYASEVPFWEKIYTESDKRVLEIGSRARSGISRRHLFPSSFQYTGLDIAPGENVDVVGDAHRMGDFLPADHFDYAFSVSVWEHLIMPWKVSLELNRVMKTGGIAMIATHQTWPSHEEPWDYFRFSDFCWDSLFNRDTGFEIIGRGTGVKCMIAATRFFPPVTDGKHEWHYGYLATRVIAKKIGPTQLSWPVDPQTLTKGNYAH